VIRGHGILAWIGVLMRYFPVIDDTKVFEADIVNIFPRPQQRCSCQANIAVLSSTIPFGKLCKGHATDAPSIAWSSTRILQGSKQYEGVDVIEDI
jgi:hypothetical protein